MSRPIELGSGQVASVEDRTIIHFGSPDGAQYATNSVLIITEPAQ